MTPTLTSHGALAAAVVLEVAGTALLQQSQQFTRPLPTIAMALCYVGAFYLLSITLKSMPVGTAYALWSGLGIILTAAVGFVVFRQRLDAAALIGMALIIGGVVIINLFSRSVAH